MSWERQVEQEKELMMDLDEEDSSSGSGSSTRKDQNQEQVVMIRSRDSFLRRMTKDSLRVLLIEGDDSTRHIIAALLLKCNYKVAAVPDGLKAWEMLKERPHSIDVVLAEVEVPSISGTSLLSMIMDHESCKHIPVLMMSSHDSINMVFKCMLKGAADFLVKPIRKNELRNLWQHVWRRHTLSKGHGGRNVHRDDNAKEKPEANSHKANQLNGYALPMQINKECSEKGSGAESSCTRSDMEAESTYKQNTLKPQQTCKGFSSPSDTIRQSGEEEIQPNGSFLDPESKAEDKSTMLGSEFTPFSGTCMGNEQLLEECSYALVETTNEEVKPMGSIYNNTIPNEMEDQTCEQGTPPKQTINLISAIDNKRHCSYGLRKNTAINNDLHDNREVVFRNEDFSCNSGSLPLLELSLRRYPHSCVDKEERNERSTLNHSNSSAFSVYHSRTPVSPLSKTVNLQAEGEEYYSPSTRQIPDKGIDGSSNVPRWNGTAHELNTEDAKFPSVGASRQNGIAIKCSPTRVIPVPIPVGGINFDRSAGYHTVMQPIFNPESSALPLWSANPSKGQGAIPMNSSDQPDTRDFYISHQHPQNQSPKSPTLYSAQTEHVNMELRDELWHVASVTGDSASSSICHGSANRIDSKGLGRICNESNSNNNSTTISHVTAELRNQVEKKPTDLFCLNQREAALNKFRLKRKDRCFEKKVRYQNRKRLAEQRPRVKGQFVRHIQPGAPSIEAGSYQIEPSVG